VIAVSENTHLPIPRTPNLRNRQTGPGSELPDYASEYYTAAWGSPYQLSPSLLSQSARTAVSEQAQSDRFTNSSPGPSFSLEHLIPSRFNDQPTPGAYPSFLDVPVSDAQEEDYDHTPRSRTKRWAQVPYRPLARSQWFSDDSVFTSRSRDVSVSTVASSGGKASRGHKTREDNRTLDQQSFWDIIQEGKSAVMAGLQGSRWAATPPEDDPPAKAFVPQGSKLAGYFGEKPLPQPPSEDGELAMETPRALEFSGMDKKEHDAESEAETRMGQPVIEVSEEEPSKGEKSSDDEKLEKVATITADETQRHNPADLVKPMPEPARLAPPKLRKRVSWRGKNCIISIPKLDYDAFGLMKPMSSQEFQARLKSFEDQGYDTRGFDLGSAAPENEICMHAKPIWPDESDMKSQSASKQAHKVQLPNLRLWADYMDALTEARLAALGVSLGDDEPVISPAQDMSRQPSGQYPPLPFSPPISTGSAASFGRPGMVRGHSHTMSMAASPISPLNGPFGHMHRHSTFHGAFPGFVSPGQQPQEQQRQAPIPGLGNFSPITQQHMPRIGSPAQVTALRNELGGIRGPGSPLSQQIMPMSAQDYSRGMVDDQRRRAHGYSQSVQVPSMSRNFSPQIGRMSVGPQSALPELLEDEDEEEEEEEPQSYVTPVKRELINNEIAIPTPRGHRHNISEGLEREVEEAEQRRQVDEVKPFTFGQIGSQAPIPNGFHHQSNDHEPSTAPTPPEEKDPLGGDFIVAESARGHRKTGTRANIVPPVVPAAPPASSFRFNPSAEFQPGAAAFSFGGLSTQPAAPQPTAPQFDAPQSMGHTRQKSSGQFNPAAITFEPGNPSTVPSSGFSFSSNGPTFTPNAPAFLPTSTDAGPSDEGKIFSNVAIPEIVKPSKKSAAVPILVPIQESRNAGSGTEVEDSEGRVGRGDERTKRQRARGGSDGDDIPQFAEPTHFPVIPTQPADEFPSPVATYKSPVRPTIKEIEAEANKAINQTAEQTETAAVEQPRELTPTPATQQPAYKRGHKKSSSSLSAMAPPFVFHGTKPSFEVIKSPARSTHVPQASISELEEGEILEEEPVNIAPELTLDALNEHSEDRDSTASLSEPLRPYNLPDSLDTSDEPRGEPTFDEIDAIMQAMNDAEAAPIASPTKTVSPPRSPDLQPPKGVTYLPGWPRSDAPSPSPKRHQLLYQQQNDSSFTAHDRTDSGEHQGMNGWPPQRINKDDEVPHSDWSGLLSPIDEDKLQSRSMFFDSHIDSIIGRVVDRRLQPLENSLRAIQNTVSKRSRSNDQYLSLKPRSSSIAESDADDEDDVHDSQRNRPVSRGRDQKLGQIKAIVMEAIREQGPASAQSYHDIADLHSALADMKVSFARAASASLELDDIKLVVEEAVNRQPKAIMPAEKDNSEALARQVSELQGRLDETLANALEEANHRQQTEAREADVRRMLKLAEEELKLLRESSQDDDARLHALEQERQELRHRAETAERAQEDAEERASNLEAEHEAMQATLEEYRTSSNRWRQEIDENNTEREALQNTVSKLEQRLREKHEARTLDKRGFESIIAELELRNQAEQEAAKREKAEHAVIVANLEQQNVDILAKTVTEIEQRTQLEQEKSIAEHEKAIAEIEQRTQLEHEKIIVEHEKVIVELEQRTELELETSKRERVQLEAIIADLQRQGQIGREAAGRERDNLENTIKDLESTIKDLEKQFEDTQDSGNGMRRRLEKLHSDMATAAGQLASEKTSWKAAEEEYITRLDELEAQNAAYSRDYAALTEEVTELRAVATEAADAKSTLDNMRTSKSSLDEMVRKQQAELRDQQALAARWERDYQDARESARSEIQRTRMSLETDVEAANHQVNIVRAQYESELARTRAEYDSEIARIRNELDNVRMDADTAKERHALVLEAESDSKREALRKVNHDNSVALDKARHNYDAAVEDLKAQHSRALRHATEDKDRSEYFLNERLRLADAKLEHFQDRVVHLEDRLEVTKSAAQAAAMSAQGKVSPKPTSRSTIPEKVSPQALRESILVLQEQLQDRETHIEQLQNKVKVEGPEKIKERDTEIAWLRELLGVRSEELTELINALSRPTFDRETVRDTAIRIRANLQMEQQEKERFGQAPSLPGQALASLTSFATPKATSLFNKWRSSMESNTLKSQQASRAGSNAASRSNTPSRPSISTRAPPSFSAGLMTPPATNIRSSPAPEATRSLPAPALARTESPKQQETAPVAVSSKAQGKQPVTDFAMPADDPTTPPEDFTAHEFDEDADVAQTQITDFDDDLEAEAEGDESLDDLDDNQPPAFRSLEEELDDPSTIAGGEDEGA